MCVFYGPAGDEVTHAHLDVAEGPTGRVPVGEMSLGSAAVLCCSFHDPRK